MDLTGSEEVEQMTITFFVEPKTSPGAFADWPFAAFQEDVADIVKGVGSDWKILHASRGTSGFVLIEVYPSQLHG